MSEMTLEEIREKRKLVEDLIVKFDKLHKEIKRHKQYNEWKKTKKVWMPADLQDFLRKEKKRG